MQGNAPRRLTRDQTVGGAAAGAGEAALAAGAVKVAVGAGADSPAAAAQAVTVTAATTAPRPPSTLGRRQLVFTIQQCDRICRRRSPAGNFIKCHRRDQRIRRGLVVIAVAVFFRVHGAISVRRVIGVFVILRGRRGAGWRGRMRGGVEQRR